MIKKTGHQELEMPDCLWYTELTGKYPLISCDQRRSPLRKRGVIALPYNIITGFEEVEMRKTAPVIIFKAAVLW